MEAKDGSFGFDFEATYSQVSTNSKIVYTLTDGRSVTIDFAEKNGQTNLTITFEAERMNPLETQKNGWQAILNNFKKYAELTDF